MTIRLPQDLEAFVRSEVANGHFASQDDLVEAALRDFARRNAEEPQAADSTGSKPIWERILEMAREVPADVWERLPTDLAENHDRYLLGHAGRSDS